MKTAQKVIRVAKALAKIMTRSQDVKVTISGRTAYRTPGHINVPFGDFSNPDIVSMTHGYIDHELGHEENTNHSDFAAFGIKSPTHKHILNIIEDVRMEKAVGNSYPGAKRNLETLAGLAIKHELFQEPTSKSSSIHLIQAFCLYHGRAHVLQQSCLHNFAKTTRELLIAKLGNELVDEITRLVESTDHAKDTQDAVNIAQAIIELLEQQKDDEDSGSGDSSDDNSGNSESADSDSSGDSDASSDADDDNADDSEGDDSSSSSKSDASDSSGSQDEGSDDDSESGEQEGETSDSSDPTDAQSDNKSNSSSELGGDIEQAIRDILEASDEDGLKDFHESVAEMLEDKAEDEPLAELGSGALDLLPIKKRCHLGTPFRQSEAKASGKRVFNALNRVLIDEVNSNPIHRNRGKKINQRRLSGVPVGKDRIFKRYNHQQDTSAAISFVVDASGSMDEMMEEVNACAYAFSSGLQAPGIVTETLYFAALNAEDSVYIAKSFDEKPQAKRFNVSCWGGTPTGEAMLSALTRLSVREEANKILFVITDGRSNSPQAVAKARKMAEIMNVRVVPIGINTGFIHGFREEEFKSINSVSELAGAVKHAVREKLFVKAA